MVNGIDDKLHLKNQKENGATHIPITISPRYASARIGDSLVT